MYEFLAKQKGGLVLNSFRQLVIKALLYKVMHCLGANAVLGHHLFFDEKSGWLLSYIAELETRTTCPKPLAELKCSISIVRVDKEQKQMSMIQHGTSCFYPKAVTVFLSILFQKHEFLKGCNKLQGQCWLFPHAFTMFNAFYTFPVLPWK